MNYVYGTIFQDFGYRHHYKALEIFCDNFTILFFSKRTNIQRCQPHRLKYLREGEGSETKSVY